MEQIKATEEEQRASEHAQHKSEDEAQSQQIKIQQAELSLYGGLVRNPKELQDLQADIASLKETLGSAGRTRTARHAQNGIRTGRRKKGPA